MSANTDAAREAARTPNGQFGEQEHSSPEVSIDAPANSAAKRTLGHYVDRYLQLSIGRWNTADMERMQANIEAFVAEANFLAPEAARARFTGYFSEDGFALTFDQFEDANGEAVESDDDPAWVIEVDGWDQADHILDADPDDRDSFTLDLFTVPPATDQLESQYRAEMHGFELERGGHYHGVVDSVLRAAAAADPDAAAAIEGLDPEQARALYESVVALAIERVKGP